MPILLQQYQEVILLLLINFFKRNLLIFVGIFSPLGEPILMRLLRYRAFAVDNHSCIPCASHLHQPRLVNNSG
jgi:hypothetical protein